VAHFDGVVWLIIATEESKTTASKTSICFIALGNNMRN